LTVGLRRGLIVAVALVALASIGAARRHGTIGLVIHSDGAGSVWATATWEDGHPVDGPVAATLLAVSETGQRVGPAALTRVAGTGPLVYERALAAGTWRVVVDVAAPGLGHCEASVRIGPAEAPAPPSEMRCLPPTFASIPAAENAENGDDGPDWVWIAVALALLGVAAGSIVALFSRSSK